MTKLAIRLRESLLPVDGWKPTLFAIVLNRGSFQDAEEGPGFAPTFVEKPRIIPNETGTLITMKCKCKANPKPEVTWFRGTNVVKESSKISIKTTTVEEDVYELVMEIKVMSLKFFTFCHIMCKFKFTYMK